MKIAGLSIEGSKIKAAIVSRGIGSVKAIATDEITLPPTPEERDNAFGAALAKWKETHGISGVIVGLGLSHFSHRIVDIPVRSKDDIRHALAFEMEKHLPLEPDQYSIDFHIIESYKEGTKNLVFAIRKEKLKWIFDCLSGAGLKFLGVKCSLIEATNELLTTVNANDALMVYQSENTYQLVGITSSNPDILKVAKSREEAVSDIEKLLDTHGKTLYVAGDKSMPEFERFNPRTLPLNMANLVAATASGKRRVRTDFAPREFTTPKRDYYPYALVLLCAACVVIFFSTTILAYVKDYRALRYVDKRIESIKAETRQVIESEGKVAAASDKIRFLKKFNLEKNENIKALAELSTVLPKNAWLTSLSIDEQGKVEIEGFADRATDIIAPLENSYLFKDVEFSSPVTVKEGIERFSLKMKVEQIKMGAGNK